MTFPSPQSLLDQVATGAMTPHETKISKMSLNLRQFQSHMCYLQAKLFLTTGVSGGWSEAAQELYLVGLEPRTGAASFSSKLFAIKDAERPCSSKNLAAQDVEQPSSSKTLVSKDVDQPATEDVENPLAAAADSNPDECTSSASSSSSSNSALPVVDTSGWGSEWHDVWQNAIALDRQCSGSKKRPQALKNLLKGIYVAKRRVDDPCPRQQMHGSVET